MFRIKEGKLNNFTVKPIVTVQGNDPTKIKGGNLIPSVYGVTLLCAKRKSGKTSVLNEILTRTSDKRTIFWLFVPTAKIDTAWIEIIKKLKEKGNQVNVFESIMDGKINQLDEIILSLQNPDEPEDPGEKIIPKPNSKLRFPEDAIEEEKKKKRVYKPKKVAPEHIFVFDDISHQLKHKSVETLLKKARHFKGACYISYQYVNDLTPGSYKQAEFLLAFKSFSRDKLEHVHKHLDLSIPIETLFDLYDHVHKEPGYDFLYIDVRSQLYRKNFNRKLDIDGII